MWNALRNLEHHPGFVHQVGKMRNTKSWERKILKIPVSAITEVNQICAGLVGEHEVLLIVKLQNKHNLCREGWGIKSSTVQVGKIGVSDSSPCLITVAFFQD